MFISSYGIHFVFLKRSYLRKWLENMTDPSGDSNVVATFLSKIASNIKASKHYLSNRHSGELSPYDFSEFNAQCYTTSLTCDMLMLFHTLRNFS